MTALRRTPTSAADPSPRSAQRFEIYIEPGFCEFECAAISNTLLKANEVQTARTYSWRFTSYKPGLLNGRSGMIARAEPAVDNHDLSDVLGVAGGRMRAGTEWMRRVRQMSRLGRPSLLLSSAAAHYVRQTKEPIGAVTTHWRDAAVLRETGDYPALTNQLSAWSGHVQTAAGSGATTEVILNLIGPDFAPATLADLANRLMLQSVRAGTQGQPGDRMQGAAVLDNRLRAAIQIMEDRLEDPVTISDLTDQIGLSARHLERLFKDAFHQTPARFYKAIRSKRAQIMIEETRLPLADIAAATGFGSTNSLCAAIRQDTQMTPTQLRRHRHPARADTL
jgi:transcriptional regulator GlxA family with amidase domain